MLFKTTAPLALLNTYRQVYLKLQLQLNKGRNCYFYYKSHGSKITCHHSLL